MNCKPGDLAMYVGKPVMAIEIDTGVKLPIVPSGLICFCISHVIMHGQDYWNIEPRNVELKWPSGRYFSGVITALRDCDLRPLRGDGDQELLEDRVYESA